MDEENPAKSEPPDSPDAQRDSDDYDDYDDNDSDSSDPVVAEYPVYLNPQIDYETCLLQFPERSKEQPYAEANQHQKPEELRVKPNTRQVEADVPIPTSINYNRAKGRIWAEALSKSKIIQSGGSHGIAGGFGIGLESKIKGKVKTGDEMDTDEDEDEEMELENPYDELESDENDTAPKLTSQTLGGQFNKWEEGDPTYTVGAFRKNEKTEDIEFYLTPLAGISQLRPQFHHIDALVEEQKVNKIGVGTGEPVQEVEARAVNMRVANAGKGKIKTEESDVARTIKAIQAEKWNAYEWRDNDAPDTWEQYFNTMFVAPDEYKPHLQSEVSKFEWLDSFSAPRIDPVKKEQPKMRYPGQEDDE